MNHKRPILLAFSGGIDSCASAESLRNAGWVVELLTIDMLGDEEMLRGVRERAQSLDLPLHIVDERELFEREIIDYFTAEYCAGRTPAPCTRCNSAIKWEILAHEADRLGIYHISTGHYFRVAMHEGRYYVRRGVDSRKDQSYYLWDVAEQTLRRVVTPMGEREKAEVMVARGERRKESMGVCFLHGAHYADFLRDRCGEGAGGDIIDVESGEVVGRHNSIARYTIGQKRGVGIPPARCVVRIEGERNRVYVGEDDALWRTSVDIAACHFINREEALSSDKIEVMVRGIGRNPEGYARITECGEGRCRLHLTGRGAWAVAAGQPVALYIEDRVIGGGYAL